MTGKCLERWEECGGGITKAREEDLSCRGACSTVLCTAERVKGNECRQEI